MNAVINTVQNDTKEKEEEGNGKWSEMCIEGVNGKREREKERYF